jgi:hypothetical protein
MVQEESLRTQMLRKLPLVVIQLEPTKVVSKVVLLVALQERNPPPLPLHCPITREERGGQRVGSALFADNVCPVFPLL